MIAINNSYCIIPTRGQEMGLDECELGDLVNVLGEDPITTTIDSITITTNSITITTITITITINSITSTSTRTRTSDMKIRNATNNNMSLIIMCLLV